MGAAAHFLVFTGGDLLQEVCYTLTLGACKTLLLEKVHHMLPRAVVCNVACTRQIPYQGGVRLCCL